MRSRRLILHIGYYKTGTTALQDHLAASPDLHRRRILYPEGGRPAAGFNNHSGWAFQQLATFDRHLPFWYRQSKPYQAFVEGNVPTAIEELRAEVKHARPRTIILSSEELVRFAFEEIPPDEPRRQIERLGVDRLTVVCYLRRPDRYLDSWYNQLVKMATAQHRLSENVAHFLGTEHTDYDRALTYWSRDVGCDELIVRDYDAVERSSIVQDFAEATGVEIGDPCPAGEMPANPRIDNNFIEHARLFANFREGEPNPALFALYERLARETGFPPPQVVDVLDEDARRRLHEYFVPVNERIGKLLGRNEPFFADLEQMLEGPEGAISDVDAFRFWEPYVSVAMRAARID